MDFEFSFEDNLLALHEDLHEEKYQHGPYTSFYVHDPKLRHIHKALVRDWLVHQAVFRVLYPIFDQKFISDSYSCRIGKGTHRGVKRLEEFSRKVSKNHQVSAYALKCDIQKFFHSIDHHILLRLIKRWLSDSNALRLVGVILSSFELEPHSGLPLGNVTSQLFANIYLNELDQFVKHTLREKYYLRYCDDFLMLSSDKNHLNSRIHLIQKFLSQKLRLRLHPKKVIIRKFSRGIDFLGYITIPQYTIIRTKTRRRIFRRIQLKKAKLKMGALSPKSFSLSLHSYLGMLRHCRGHKIIKKLFRAAEL